MKKQFLRLTDAPRDLQLQVVQINAGHIARTRLNHLGIVPGSVIEKEQSAPFRGPVCVKVKGSHLCIGRGLANKVFVQAEN